MASTEADRPFLIDKLKSDLDLPPATKFLLSLCVADQTPHFSVYGNLWEAHDDHGGRISHNQIPKGSTSEAVSGFQSILVKAWQMNLIDASKPAQ